MIPSEPKERDRQLTGEVIYRPLTIPCNETEGEVIYRPLMIPSHALATEN